MHSKFWYLRNFFPADTVDDASLVEMERVTSMKILERHEFITFSYPEDVVYMIKQGFLKISRLNDAGEEMLVEILGPGEYFGELPAMSARKGEYSELATAVSDVAICVFRKKSFEHLLITNPYIGFQVLKQTHSRLHVIEERVSDLAFKTVRERLANLLVRLANQFGTEQEGIICIQPKLTHQEVAYLIASTRPTVTALLNEFRDAGWIDIQHKQIFVCNAQALEHYHE